MSVPAREESGGSGTPAPPAARGVPAPTAAGGCSGSGGTLILVGLRCPLGSRQQDPSHPDPAPPGHCRRRARGFYGTGGTWKPPPKREAAAGRSPQPQAPAGAAGLRAPGGEETPRDAPGPPRSGGLDGGGRRAQPGAACAAGPRRQRELRPASRGHGDTAGCADTAAKAGKPPAPPTETSDLSATKQFVFVYA